jgi:hypothetical protein
MVERLVEGNFLQQLNQRLGGVLGRRNWVVDTRYFRGNGYHYEADEVMECVRGGRLESAVMPLSESLALAELMDKARAGWAAGAAAQLGARV